MTRKAFLEFADQLGVNPRAALRLLDELVARISGEADELAMELEGFTFPEPIVRAGQLRAVNNIRFVAIRDMVERLRKP